MSAGGAGPVPARRPLTAIIPTFNEEESLPACLDSVRFADEILVVDSFSTDRTVAIARERGARVIQRDYGYSASQKNWAMDQVAHDWILIFDADERCNEVDLVDVGHHADAQAHSEYDTSTSDWLRWSSPSVQGSGTGGVAPAAVRPAACVEKCASWWYTLPADFLRS